MLFLPLDDPLADFLLDLLVEALLESEKLCALARIEYGFQAFIELLIAVDDGAAKSEFCFGLAAKLARQRSVGKAHMGLTQLANASGPSSAAPRLYGSGSDVSTAADRSLT